MRHFAAPMHGTVVALLVEPGNTVAAGDPVIVIEAMKMEQTLRAPTAGSWSMPFNCAPAISSIAATSLVASRAEGRGMMSRLPDAPCRIVEVGPRTGCRTNRRLALATRSPWSRARRPGSRYHRDRQLRESALDAADG
jgi:hypothetical protein